MAETRILLKFQQNNSLQLTVPSQLRQAVGYIDFQMGNDKTPPKHENLSEKVQRTPISKHALSPLQQAA